MKYIYLIISVVGSIYLGGLLIGYNYSNQNGLYINIDFYFQIFFIYPQLFITIGSAYLFFKKLNENVAINNKIITTNNPSVEKQKKKNLNSNLNSNIKNQTKK